MDVAFILIFLLTIIASFIQRVCGFGFGIFVMMFFPFILTSYGESVTLSGLLAGTTALLIALKNFKHIQWKIMYIIVLCNVLISYVAIEYMASLSNDTLKRCLGVVLILIACYFMFYDGKTSKSSESKILQMITGCISGVMGGMFAMPGPPVVFYCIGKIDDKLQYMATLQAFSIIFNIFYTLFRVHAGFFSDDTIFYWLTGLAGLVVGTWLGSKCFEFISRETLKKTVYIMMIISGVVSMF